MVKRIAISLAGSALAALATNSLMAQPPAASSGPLNVTLGEPIVVTTSPPAEKRWGYYQFPRIWRDLDGTIMVGVNVRPDDARWLEQPDAPFESRDGGQTWSPLQNTVRQPHLTLSNGDQLHREAAMFRLEDITLPAPVGVFVNNYGLKYPLYRWPDINATLAADCFRIFYRKNGSAQWQRRPATVDDPGVLCTSINTGVFVPFGNGCCEFHEAPDGGLIHLGYRVRLQDDGEPDRYTGPWLLRSTDGGKIWRYHGSIRYRPDPDADSKAEDRLGFTEPTMLLDERRAICVMRTTDGLGLGPMYQSHSNDMGRSWSKPRVIAEYGVRPRLLRLENGVMVLSSGRPGVQLHFSTDEGRTWSESTSILNGDRSAITDDSCGYTDLLATGPDRCLITYSHFKHLDREGQQRKAILVQEVIVTH